MQRRRQSIIPSAESFFSSHLIPESPLHLSTYPFSVSLSPSPFILLPFSLVLPYPPPSFFLFLFLSRSISCLFTHPNDCSILLSIYRACGMKCVCVCSRVSAWHLCNSAYPYVYARSMALRMVLFVSDWSRRNLCTELCLPSLGCCHISCGAGATTFKSDAVSHPPFNCNSPRNEIAYETNDLFIRPKWLMLNFEWQFYSLDNDGDYGRLCTSVASVCCHCHVIITTSCHCACLHWAWSKTVVLLWCVQHCTSFDPFLRCGDIMCPCSSLCGLL